jgi:spermidine/putrescine transport system substrate-binding protein
MKYQASSLWIKIIVVAVWSIIIVGFMFVGRITDLFSSGKSINVLVWGQVLDKEFLVDFEKETGIQLNMSYFENNEDLFAKLQSTDMHDYDLIVPSDWAAQLMIEQGLIKKLDRSKITVWDTLYPTLCNLYFDPGNEYTIPFYWSLFGLGINKNYWREFPSTPTWGLIFDENLLHQKISVSEDPRALILLSALYLFGDIDQLTPVHIDAIKKLLKKQKSRVEIYTDSRVEYVLASGVVPVAVALSGDLLKVMKNFDFIDFVLPQEGGFVVIDSFAMPATTKKDEFVYQFLNYLFRPDIVMQYVEKFDFFPAVKVDVTFDGISAELAEPTEAIFKNINFFKNIVSKEMLNDVLLFLKS